jgi:DinB family
VREFLAAIRDEDLERVVEFAIGDGPKQALSIGQMMHHAAIHSVHHRGQLALLLRSLGYVPGNFDIVFYYGRSQDESMTNVHSLIVTTSEFGEIQRRLADLAPNPASAPLQPPSLKTGN